MAKNRAIVIGINQYQILQSLKYAKRDAELMAHFLQNSAGFDQVFLFSDDSPEIRGKSTRPFRSNILRVFREFFETPFMSDGDNFWFFFAGHGMRYGERDYLMPLDADPDDVENTGISTNYLTERLRRCGADNVVMLLDACRNMGSRAGEGIGNQTAKEARQTGVISIFSCSPNQFSHEVESIQQGAFTYALLEGLGIRGRCATVERLNQYLEHRVPEILREALLNARQTPYTIAEPANRSHLILVPEYASLAEIAVLKNDAYRSESVQDWSLAKRLWIRVLAAALGQDMDAVEALERIALKKAEQKSIPPPPQQSLDTSKPLGQARLAGKVPLPHTPHQLNTQPVQLPPQDDLSSEKDVDYRKLRDLLRAGKWREADEETLNVMLQAASQPANTFLVSDDITKLPYRDLQTINQLWLSYSKEQFGFSIQQRIYQDVGEDWTSFIESVGWLNLEVIPPPIRTSPPATHPDFLKRQKQRRKQQLESVENRLEQIEDGWRLEPSEEDDWRLGILDFKERLQNKQPVRRRRYQDENLEKWLQRTGHYSEWQKLNKLKNDLILEIQQLELGSTANRYNEKEYKEWLKEEKGRYETWLEEEREQQNWRKKENITKKAYEQLTFSLSAPRGHLPAKCYGMSSLDIWGLAWSGQDIVLRQDLR